MKLDVEIKNQIDIIPTCTNVMQLRRCLNRIIKTIDDMALSDHFAMDKVIVLAKMAQKGIRNKAKIIPGEFAFICGQAFEKIESIINACRVKRHNDAVKEIMSASTSQTIVKFLWRNGCCVRNMVLMDTKLSQDLFDLYIDELINLNIIRQDVTPQCTWVELSTNGYGYARKHYFEKEGFNIW